MAQEPSLIDESFQSIFLILVVIPAEIIPTHLIYYDSYHELRALVKLRLCLTVNNIAQRQCNE